MIRFLTQMAIASLVDQTRLSQTGNASVPLDILSTVVDFALSHATMVSSPSKEDALFVLSTLSSELRSMVVIVLLDFTRTISAFVRNWYSDL